MVEEEVKRPRDIMHLGPVEMTDKSANPAPLGLMGFGMTTVLLNMANAGWFPLVPNTFHGYLLWRYRPDHRGLHGMEKREYLWNNGIHLLWVVLAYSGLPVIDP